MSVNVIPNPTQPVSQSSTPWPVDNQPQTSGGLSIGKLLSAATTNSTNLKGSAGQVFSIVVVNTNAAVRYFKLYNKATAPTVGTDVPVATFALPAGGGVSIAIDKGLAFSLGIGYAMTTGAADADVGAVAANEITGIVGYK